MAQLNQVFDATQVDPANSFDPVPNGEYAMAFTSSEIKDTKRGDGTYLQLTAEIIDGPYKGRLIWERINLSNPNSTAVEIGQKTLSAICHVLDVPRLQDSVELHNKPFIAKVIVKHSDGYEPSNEIKGYKDAGGNQPGGAVMEAVPTTAQPAAAAAPAPGNWAQGGSNPFRAS
ncbi:MAG: DUF669 domain-containing protein [Spongiibacteraceae bacterium]